MGGVVSFLIQYLPFPPLILQHPQHLNGRCCDPGCGKFRHLREEIEELLNSNALQDTQSMII